MISVFVSDLIFTFGDQPRIILIEKLYAAHHLIVIFFGVDICYRSVTYKEARVGQIVNFSFVLFHLWCKFPPPIRDHRHFWQNNNIICVRAGSPTILFNTFLLIYQEFSGRQNV